jgi:LPXTG-motif cell wall-anchored protein
MDVAVGPTLAVYAGIVLAIVAVVWLLRRRR